MQEKIEQWIQALKIALLENNTEAAFLLTQNLPFDSNMDTSSKEMREYLDIARELIAQTISMLEKSQDETRKQIERIRHARKFLLE